MAPVSNRCHVFISRKAEKLKHEGTIKFFLKMILINGKCFQPVEHIEPLKHHKPLKPPKPLLSYLPSFPNKIVPIKILRKQQIN